MKLTYRTTVATGIALAACVLTSAGASAATHVASVDHSTGTIEALYQGAVQVEHREVGTPGPGGRSSTARCVWTAHLAIDRTASTPAGTRVSRSFVQDRVAQVSRPGWCRTGGDAVQQELIARLGDVEQHIRRAAQDDRAMLLAELDRTAEMDKAGG